MCKYMFKGWESWGCSVWRTAGSRATSWWPSSTWEDLWGKWHRLFSRACWNGTRANGFRLKEVRLPIRKMFFAMRMIKHWARLFREVVEVSCLETFKGGWMELWTTWSGWRCPFALQGGWTRGLLKVPSNANYCMISKWKLVECKCICVELC